MDATSARVPSLAVHLSTDDLTRMLDQLQEKL